MFNIIFSKISFFKSILFLSFLLNFCYAYEDSYILHNTVIEDPYIWLEEMDSDETKNWIKEQNEKTDQYFEKLTFKNAIKQKILDNSNYERYYLGAKTKHGYIFAMRDQNEDKPCLCIEDRSKNIKKLIDPNSFENKNLSIVGLQISPDENILTYGLTDSGSDSTTWKVLDLISNEHLLDELFDIKYQSPKWSFDSTSLYYVKSFTDSSNEKSRFGIFYHQIDADTKNDRLIYDTKEDQTLLCNIYPTSDGEYLLFTTKINGENTNYILDINSEEIIFSNNGKYSLIGEAQDKLYFQTNVDAPNYKLVAVDLKSPNIESLFEEIIPENDLMFVDACLTKDYIVCSYFENCSSALKIFDYSGNFIKDIELPTKGSIVLSHDAISTIDEENTNEVIFAYTDFTTPLAIFSYDISSSKLNTLFKPSLNTENAKSRFTTKQVFFESKDKTLIPMFITYKDDIKLDGNKETLMTGYGGFNIPLTPCFSSLYYSFLELGGIFVLVNLRGGSEYGDNWHDMGKLENKQNVFDDFIAAAEYLIDNSYTNPKKLAITGRSNGGLLVGATMLQRPDLFKAVVGGVGVYDMLKFHKFTIGWYWKYNYGNPDDINDFEYIYKYSPYHNINIEEKYPSILLTTADHDDRVVPLHTYKFGAKLLDTKSENPILIKIHENSGHGNASLKIANDENSAILSFLVEELKMDIDIDN
ncbi:MAG: Prolyl endopeptidase [Candidatus Anoxychlamydiales bacterium]|nr:Prolyl endopeptidase [Candidatus Anoxychlamydiales bacterium]